MGNGIFATPWDWSGVIGTGQSLAAGAEGTPVESTEQPFGNLKLTSADLEWPVDPGDPDLKLEPLTEPIGRQPDDYPHSWPTNILGETPHSSSANQISHLVRQHAGRDYVGVHIDVAESGQGMIRIRKSSIREGVSERAYEASMIQTRAIARLAKAAGKTYGVGAIFLTHGETDTENSQYEEELHDLWSDYNADIKAITGQSEDVVMIVSQHNRLGEYSPSTIAQWRIGDAHPADIVCSGPKYQYPYSADALHMLTAGYRLLGEKFGQVYFERVVLGQKWKPLGPETISRDRNRLEIRFHVPVKPLVWDRTLGEPHPSSPEWSNGKGFELTDKDGHRKTILEARITGDDTVVLDLSDDAGEGARLSYALVGEPTLRDPQFNAIHHWGLLRDSDPFIGFGTGIAQPNFCVAFEMRVP